jgi:DNA polymerase III delta prime subunit
MIISGPVVLTRGDSRTALVVAAWWRSRAEVQSIEREQWTIEDSRELATLLSRRHPMGNQRCFLIVVRSVIAEAQHALLKILEEPPAQTFVHWVIPAGVVLLPTLESRCAVVDVPPELYDAEVDHYAQWSKLALKEKLEMAEKMAALKDGYWFEAIKTGAARWVRANARALSPTLRDRWQQSLSMLGQRGAPHKWVLEDLALLHEESRVGQ